MLPRLEPAQPSPAIGGLTTRPPLWKGMIRMSTLWLAVGSPGTLGPAGVGGHPKVDQRVEAVAATRRYPTGACTGPAWVVVGSGHDAGMRPVWQVWPVHAVGGVRRAGADHRACAGRSGWVAGAATAAWRPAAADPAVVPPHALESVHTASRFSMSAVPADASVEPVGARPVGQVLEHPGGPRRRSRPPWRSG
jgi:hypothetical protein